MDFAAYIMTGLKKIGLAIATVVTTTAFCTLNSLAIPIPRTPQNAGDWQTYSSGEGHLIGKVSRDRTYEGNLVSYWEYWQSDFQDSQGAVTHMALQVRNCRTGEVMNRQLFAWNNRWQLVNQSNIASRWTPLESDDPAQTKVYLIVCGS